MTSKHKNKKPVKSTGQATDKSEDKKSGMRDFLESLIVAIILALAVKTFSLQTFQIPTGSMEDNLLVGDHLIVNKLIYGPELSFLKGLLPMRDVRRGDIVIFKYPPEPNTDYIKRVIGLPGETVRVFGHQVYINGTPIEDLGLDEDSYTLHWRKADQERARAIGVSDAYRPETDSDAKIDIVRKVPEGEYFMMGDHRYVSRDSRRWGTVPRDHITGRAVMIYWSYGADRDDYQEDGFMQQVGTILKTVINFPFRTRWDRFFRIIS